MNQEVLKFCLEKGILLDKEAYNLLSDFDIEQARNIIEKISGFKEKMITKAFFDKNAEKIMQLVDNKKFIDKIKINLGVTLEISRETVVEEKKAEKNLDNLKVIYSLANLSKKIEPGDFTIHFRNRYNEIKRMLIDRGLENLTSINKINGEKQAIAIIGMVFSKRVTKNKNIFLEIEDLGGKVSVLVNKNKPDVYDKARDILLDDIIAIKGTSNGEIIYANDIFYPDAFIQEKVFLDKDEYIAFTSDIHIGSKNFLEENFKKFIIWINGEAGNEQQKEEARKVKYLLITGDCVDGVGVFPGQEDLINIKDMREQYKKLASYLSQIRKDVKIIMCPGQHDAVRIAEPQPFIGRDFGESLYELDNVVLVSNPAVIEIGNNSRKGVRILMYHGASMNAFVNEIETLRISKAHECPSRVVKEILKRRHLSPIHSAVTYIPTEKEDPLVIKEAPDIIATADFHRPDVSNYNNILIVCSSCWQSITAFEEKVGNVPDPCKLPIVNLKTREVKIIDFSEKSEDKACLEKEGNIVCEVDKVKEVI